MGCQGVTCAAVTERARAEAMMVRKETMITVVGEGVERLLDGILRM
jgi:hypothetical protein